MGILYEYQCTGCGHQAEVAGGEDRGFFLRVQTAYCRTCRSLVDVPVGFATDHALSPEDVAAVVLDRCETCRGSDIEPWSEGEPCPRCGGFVQNAGRLAYWD